MNLSELAEYAEEQHHIREEFLWKDFPGFSVLKSPETGKWIALFGREYDRETGEVIEKCDLKCGEVQKEQDQAYLTAPFRMKGLKWRGIDFAKVTDPETVFRLFDRALAFENGKDFLIFLDNSRTGGASEGMGGGRNGEAGISGGRIYRASELPVRDHTSEEIQKKRTGRNTDAGFRKTDGFQDVPEKIIEMRRLYHYRGGSFGEKCENFFRQGEFMESYEDDAPWNGHFQKYFPTYHDLNVRQLRGYFTWRTYMRKGTFRPLPLSMTYIYCYELLSGIGVSSPEDAVEKLQKFKEAVPEQEEGALTLKRNVSRWISEFCVLHGLPPDFARGTMQDSLLAEDRALEILKTPENFSDEDVVRALMHFDTKKTGASPVLKSDRGRHLFAEVWRQAADIDPLFAELFSEPRPFDWYPLANAIHREPEIEEGTEYILDACRSYRYAGGFWKEIRYDPLFFDRKKIQDFLRGTDRILRKTLHTGSYLKEKPSEKGMEVYVKLALQKEREEERQKRIEQIHIDFSSLDHIREDADVTRDALLTENEMENPLQDTERTANRNGNRGRNPVQKPEEVRQQINGQNPGQEAEKRPARNAEISPAQNTDLTSEQNSWKKTENHAKNDPEQPPAEIPEQTGHYDRAGLSVLQRTILTELLRGNPVNGLLKEEHVLPSVAADALNETLFDEIGDNVLECDGEDISLVEDYREDVADLLGM